MNNKPAYLRGKGQGRGRGRGYTSDGGGSRDAQRWEPQNGTTIVSLKPGLPVPGTSWSTWKTPSPITTDKTEVKENTDAFAKASSRHQEALKRHLQDFVDDAESDEEDVADKVIENIFKSYSASYDGDEDSQDDISKAQEHLLHSFRSGASACLICIDNIKREDVIWTCQGCYCMLHLQCIQKWVREGVYQQQYQADLSAGTTDSGFPWFCPKCRHEYKQIECPTHSYCFCGKVCDPKFDPWLIPHSCGQTCGRGLKPICGHSCLLNCHPGPCPPCPKMVQASCHCGKSVPIARRCNARSWACGKICRRTLSCDQHSCEDACHPGECKPCSKSSMQPCSCGKEKASRPCASPQWHCEQMCGRCLSCGNHLCEKICHSGQCGTCPRSGIRKCPCKKTEYELPCTEDILTCGDTCGQLLQCGVHTCTQRCHQGSCGQCLQLTLKRCRCGQSQKEVLCSKEYLCEKKCTNQRDCGKHQCRRKCCDGHCPCCEQTCGKTLGCRNHKCLSRCHRGPCYPCRETKDITCFCKATKITVPCGKEKVTKPPRCNLPCKKPSDCHHPERQKHHCHFGECPPCSQVCRNKLPACQHTCPALCHDVVKVKVEDKTKKEGPWEGRRTSYIETVRQPCPPCQVPTPIECMGKHEVTNFPCSGVQQYLCGRKCERQLACSNHTCQLECHVVTGAPDSHQAGENCEPCESQCQKPRPEGCTHACLQSCHPGNCPPCTTMVRMRCHCQAVVKHIACYEWLEAGPERQNSLKSCGGPCPKLMTCGHQCPNICHHGPCLDQKKCEKKVFIRCACKRKKKDLRCSERQEGEQLQCDEICEKIQTEKKEAQEEERRKKEEEDTRKQAAELEEFERHIKGRRKKPRRQKEEVAKASFGKKHQRKIIFSVVVVALVSLAVYICSM